MAVKQYNFEATDATREQVLARIGICGATGSGKSLTALKVGSRMCERMGLGPLFVIDTEHKSALRYAYSPRSGKGYKFKHVPMPEDDNSPEAYIAALDHCEHSGAGVIIIDSWSHMWAGINGVLEQVDRTTEQSRSKNAFSEGWKKWTPIHARAIERVMQSSCHIIFTLRTKVEWVVTENDRGKKEPKKMGLGAVAREGLDYEPDMFWIMEQNGKGSVVLTVEKGRVLDVDALTVGARHVDPGDAFADEVVAWCQDGEPAAPRPQHAPEAPASPPPAARPPRSLSPDIEAAMDRAKDDRATNADVAILIGHADGNVRATGWEHAIRTAPIDEVPGIVVQLREREKHPRLLADMLALCEQRIATPPGAA